MGSDAGLSHLPRLPSLVEPRTERLQLRAWRPSDRDAFAALNADAEVMRYFPGRQSRAESDGFADRIESRMAALGYGLWALETVDTGSFLGFTGLNPMPKDVPGSGGIEVGWRLARSAWGYGYATEAGRAALAVAFDLAAYDEVWSLTASTNVPSRAVMERLGLRHVATALHPALDPDSPIAEHVFYRITRAEYARQRQESRRLT
ncbi:MAG: GNAT family N-acetyltransferase [Nocardioidaceae bacterium]